MAKDYTNYDYASLVEAMTEKLKNKPGWGDGYESSMGQTLIQMMADVTDGLHYMLERRSAEVHTATARLASSIRAAVSSVGYRPRRKVSATGTLRLTLVDADGNPVNAEGNIDLPYGKVITFENTNFIVNQDYTIPAGTSTIDIDVKEGTLNSLTINFDEAPYNETHYVEFADYVDIEEYSLQVVGDEHTFSDVYDDVDGLRVRALSFASPTMPVYDIKFVKAGMRIVFGDGIFGMKPTGNVYFSWVESTGDDVSVLSQGLAFSFEESVLQDDIQVTPRNEYNYTLTNITPIRGGRDEETIDEMRDNVTAYVRTSDNAVTNFDYAFWAKRSGIGDIADIKAYGEHETNLLIFTMNNVYLTYATEDRLDLTPDQIQALRDYLDRIKVDTTHLVFRPVKPIYLGLAIDFRPHPSLPITTAQLNRVLTDRVDEYFKIKDGSIGKEFQHSEFVEYLQNLKFEFNKITYPMTDFVKVAVTGMVPIEIPQATYDVTIELSNDYVVTPNEVWNITIDGTTYTVVTTSTDSVDTLVDKMQQKIFAGTSLMLARPATNQIRITHPQDEGTFTVSAGTGDLTAYTTIQQYIQIPRPNNSFNPNVDQLLRGSVVLVDDTGAVIMEDDGNGLLVDATGTYASVEIDYAACRIEHPSVPARTYYVQFQQNSYQNFKVTRESLVDVMRIKRDGDPDNVHYFSTINILG